MNPFDKYWGEPVRDVITDSVSNRHESEVLVFLMGPYRLLDPSYLYPEIEFTNLPPDPLAPDPSRSDACQDEIEAVLKTICDELSAETGVTAFIASEVEIPTIQEVRDYDLDEPGMSVIDQSIAFARVSEGNAFVFTKAGLTTGVGAEVGAIPEYFSLRSESDRTRSPGKFCIFREAEYSEDEGRYEPRFSSASIDEMDVTYDLRFRDFADKEALLTALITYVESYVIPQSM